MNDSQMEQAIEISTIVLNRHLLVHPTYLKKLLLPKTMTGRGKGGKGLGKGGAKRHRKVLRDNIQVN